MFVVVTHRTIDHLGSGQFGVVQKGMWQSNSSTEVEVALKTLQSDSAEVDKVRFLQEAAIMGQFQHPNVVKLYGVVTVGEPVSLDQREGGWEGGRYDPCHCRC